MNKFAQFTTDGNEVVVWFSSGTTGTIEWGQKTPLAIVDGENRFAPPLGSIIEIFTDNCQRIRFGGIEKDQFVLTPNFESITLYGNDEYKLIPSSIQFTDMSYMFYGIGDTRRSQGMKTEIIFDDPSISSECIDFSYMFAKSGMFLPDMDTSKGINFSHFL